MKLKLFALAAILFLPTLILAEGNGPVSEIEQPGHFNPIVLEPKYGMEGAGIPHPLPPIIKDDKADPSGLPSLLSSGSPISIKDAPSNLNGSSIPMGSPSGAISATERLMRKIERVINKLK